MMERTDRPDHPARSEQTKSDFAEGIAAEPRTAEEQVGDFAEGVATAPRPPREERVGRFSEGIEQIPEKPEKNLEGSFAAGIESSPEARRDRERTSDPGLTGSLSWRAHQHGWRQSSWVADLVREASLR